MNLDLSKGFFGGAPAPCGQNPFHLLLADERANRGVWQWRRIHRTDSEEEFHEPGGLVIAADRRHRNFASSIFDLQRLDGPMRVAAYDRGDFGERQKSAAEREVAEISIGNRVIPVDGDQLLDERRHVGSQEHLVNTRVLLQGLQSLNEGRSDQLGKFRIGIAPAHVIAVVVPGRFRRRELFVRQMLRAWLLP